MLSSIPGYDKKKIDDYMRDIFLPNNIIKIKNLSHSIYPTIYELTEYSSRLFESDEIFIKD